MGFGSEAGVCWRFVRGCALCCRYKRGYKNVINKGIELNKDGVDCELMMETSGHGAPRENRFLDDGAYMSVRLIIEAARRRWEGRPGIRYALLVLVCASSQQFLTIVKNAVCKNHCFVATVAELHLLRLWGCLLYTSDAADE